MSKEMCGKFIPQFDIDFLFSDVNHLDNIVTTVLNNKGVRVDKIEHVKTGKTIYINFYVSGLNYSYKDIHKTTTKPITVITAHFRREAGFSTYELCQELELKGNKDLKHADFIGYDVTFWTDAYLRKFRHKKWEKLEGKNHYIYNDDIYSQEFISEVGSYLINLVAYKGK